MIKKLFNFIRYYIIKKKLFRKFYKCVIWDKLFLTLTKYSHPIDFRHTSLRETVVGLPLASCEVKS